MMASTTRNVRQVPKGSRFRHLAERLPAGPLCGQRAASVVGPRSHPPTLNPRSVRASLALEGPPVRESYFERETNGGTEARSSFVHFAIDDREEDP